MNSEATTTTGAACAKFHYWSKEAKDSGQCRRHAPQSIVFNVEKSIAYKAHFPETAATDWCGDFNPK